MPYRTGREARYLSVSTEENQIKIISQFLDTAFGYDKEMVTLLLADERVDPNMTTEDGWTALRLLRISIY